MAFDPTEQNFFDCGDGAPTLPLTTDSDSEGSIGVMERKGRKPAENAKVTVRLFAMAASVMTQLVIGLAVAVGGNPFVGLVAAVTVMTCSLTLVVAEAVKDN